VLRVYYCDHCPIPLPQGHKFPIAKYALLRQALAAEDCFELVPAPTASAGDVERAHDPAYVEAFVNGTLSGAAVRRIGFPWSAELVGRTMCSVGGTLAAARQALATGFGGSLAGGTHHAFYGEGSGFCVFNDAAVAIRNLGVRAAVVDLDVHQGDGTASIFSGDPDVLTVSLHGRHNFPFRKQTSGIDIEFEDGARDEEYLSRVREVLPAVREFAPEVIFYQSGVDGLASDRLGRLSLTHSGLLERDRLVLELCRDAQIPVVVTLGGGYADPIVDTVDAHANTFRTACGVFHQSATFGGIKASSEVKGFASGSADL